MHPGPFSWGLLSFKANKPARISGGTFWFNVMARHTVKNHWFVSVEASKQLRLASPKEPVRQTKTFPTETEAKQFAKEMLSSSKYRIVAGTLLSAHQPGRRIISGSPHSLD
jgi:hypothetical protein